jgi:diacylglycerol kinase (ATP)
MLNFIRSRTTSFRYAFSGWWYVIRTQRNAWIHAIISIIVILIGLWLQISPLEWAVIVIAFAMVWTAEFINTALEAVVDLASPQQHPMAKVGKDVGAAAVLLAAIASIIIGLLILGPPLIHKLMFLLFGKF